jgi:hypothetical protein
MITGLPVFTLSPLLGVRINKLPAPVAGSNDSSENLDLTTAEAELELST